MRVLTVEAASNEAASQHAFIAIPAYEGPSSILMHSLWAAQIALNAANIRATLEIAEGNCHVDDARNSLVRDFLESDCTDLVFIDADLGFDSVDLVKLLSHDRDVVAGVYPKKQVEDEFTVRPIPGELWTDEDGLIEVLGVSTGFLRIKRHVLEQLEADAPKFWGSKEDPRERRPIPIIFERTYAANSRFSGDYTFCEKWRKLGGSIWADPFMAFEHQGLHSWCGSVADHWKTSSGVYAKQFDDNIERLKQGDSSVIHDLRRGYANEFSAEEDLLHACYEVAKEAQGPILETGTGLSTLIMACANPNVEIHCLEHDPVFASHTQHFVDGFGLDNVTIHFGHLRDYGEWKWYDKDLIPELDYAMVLCDGPPICLARRGALYVFCGDMIRNAHILMDDANDRYVLDLRTYAEEIGRKVHILGQSRRFAVCPRSAA